MKSVLRLVGAFAVALSCSVPMTAAIAEFALGREHTELWRGSDRSINIARLCSGDVNGDGTEELVALNWVTPEDDGGYAELYVANWTTAGYAVLASQRWQVSERPTRVKAVHCVDMDGNGSTEIITAASASADDAEAAAIELRLWRWDAGLEVTASREWDAVEFESIAAMDIDVDGIIEIIVAGQHVDGEESFAVWMLQQDGDGIRIDGLHTWRVDGVGGAVRSVAARDLDGDGVVEIITVAPVANAFDLRLWHWDVGGLTQVAADQWTSGVGSEPNQLAVGDIDADTSGVIAVAGTTQAIDPVDASSALSGAIALWQWRDGELAFLDHDQWQSTRGNVEFFIAAIADVDFDAAAEAVVAGAVHVSPGANVLRVYDWQPYRIRLEAVASDEWIAEGVEQSVIYAMTTADLDADGRTEMITGGRGITTVGDPSEYAEIDISSFRWEGDWFGLTYQRLKAFLSFEGWPLYLTLRDTLPMPWPWIIYASAVAFLAVTGIYGVWRWYTRGRWR